MVVSQTNDNCWDVGSAKALTRDRGGDTRAVTGRVECALTKYSGNAARVYITGA